jgi:hypothetical protein
MREYYRSGNAFFYTFHGKFGPAYYKNFQQSFGAKENRIPIRYELLNPTNIFVPVGLAFPYTYVRLMSTYELERLKNPITVQDKQIYNDLPDVVKSQMKAGSVFPMGVWLPMDPTRLRFFFYKKQDYEPLAVPMVWPVLPDIEWKLGLKKMDKELARKVEHALLIVTTGEGPNQYNGGNGINQNNIARLQALFANQTIQRTLVADYTTKAEWAIPDLKDILGPEKYKVVDQDIKEGLQSILAGEDKFANAQMKAKIFIQRLEEGQNRFLNDFLIPEIMTISDAMGFRNIPQVGFQKIDLQDEVIMNRVITQLAQIGILTAEQTIKAIDTGLLPDANEMKLGQEEYKKEREKGLYEPLIGGQKKDEGSGSVGRPNGTGTPQTTKKISPIGTGADAFSIKGYTTLLRSSQNLLEIVKKELSKKFKVKGELNAQQNSVAEAMARAIMATHTPEKWNVDIVKASIDSPPLIPTAIGQEMDRIGLDYEVDETDAILLSYCRVQAPSQV